MPDTALQDETPAQAPAAPDSAPPASDAPARTQPARQALERLFQRYPKMFGARFLPLKLGVFQDILERHPDEFGRDELKAALALHTRSTRYLESVAMGHARHDLDGNRVEDIAPEHVHHAIMEVFRRRQSRGKDARAWLAQRLVAAIEASGLSREDYEARVHARDEPAALALDEAFGQIATQQARREAMRRAFEASGKGIDEFADMYGLQPAAVRKLLG